MSDIYSTLRGRFPENEYVLMKEVSDKAGHGRSRSADYIAVNLYPSRGLAIHGIELKSYRGDWLNELKNPSKQENHFQYCDYFWLLTEDEKIAKLEEIPVSWGWLCIRGDRIFTKKQAPQLKKPKPVTRSFMCAMLKRAASKDGYILRESIKDKIDDAYKRGEDASFREMKKLKDRLIEIEKNIDEFEKASGVSLKELTRDYFWGDPEKMGKTFKLLNDARGIDGIRGELTRLEEISKDIYEKISSTVKLLPQ